MEKVNYALEWASKEHAFINQTYGKYPYSVHLQMVVAAAKKFIHLIPEEDQELVLVAAALHDVLEDSWRISYNDLKREFGIEVAKICFALENNSGKYRWERADDAYYAKIRSTKYADFDKLADRIANMTFSKSEGSGMFKKYKKELYPYVATDEDGNLIQVKGFIEQIGNNYPEMIEYLESL